MNSRERVLTAIRGGEPDRVPIMELAIEPPIMEKMAPGASEPEFYEAVDVDGVCGFYDLLYEDVEQDVKKDCFGIKRNFTEMQGKFPVPIEPLIPPDQDPMRFLDSYKMPDGEDPRMLAQTRALVERFKGRKATAYILGSSNTIHSAVPPENFLAMIEAGREFGEYPIRL